MSDKKITVITTELTCNTRLRCMWIVMLDYTMGTLNAILAGINLSRGSYLVALGALAVVAVIGIFAALSIKNAYWVNHKTYVSNGTIPAESEDTA